MHCFSLISKCINKIIFHSISINDNDWHEIDTIEDLERIRSIASVLFPNGEFVSSESALEFLAKQNE